MKRINTLEELRAERARLLEKKKFLENEIKNDFAALKNTLKPAQLITDGASKVLVNHHHNLISGLTGLVSDFVLKKMVLKNSGFLIKLIVPFMARNAISNIVNENKSRILGKIADFILKFNHADSKREIYDQATADSNV